MQGHKRGLVISACIADERITLRLVLPNAGTSVVGEWPSVVGHQARGRFHQGFTRGAIALVSSRTAGFWRRRHGMTALAWAQTEPPSPMKPSPNTLTITEGD